MNIIETTAPIKIEELKKYFVDKETFYLINYEESSLKGVKLLTYLSNLDIPCDIKLESHTQSSDDLLLEYLNATTLVNVPFLELEAIKLLLQFKGVNDYGYSKFIKDNEEILSKWSMILDSLLYYNTYTINDDSYKEKIRNSQAYDSDLIIGVNFVSLLKYEEFYDFYMKTDPKNFKYHEVYFNDYLFKGRNLYYYWANANNPIFIITWAVETGNLDADLFGQALKKDVEEINSVSLI